MVLSVVTLFYAVPFSLLSIPAIQQKIISFTVNELHEQLGIDVTIEKVGIKFFNKIVLENLYLEDQSGEKLLEARRIAAGFNLLELFSKKLSFTTVQLFGINLHLTKETPESPLNLQFLIDALSSNDSTKTDFPFILRFNSVLLQKGNISYDLKSAPESPGRLNVNHLKIKDISSRISIKTLSKDSVDLRVRRLGLEEETGLKLNKLSFFITGNREKSSLTDFQLALPQSMLKISNITLDYSEVVNMEEFGETAKIFINVDSSKIAPSDLKAIYPSLKNFRNSISLQANIDGTLNDLHLNQCLISLTDRLHFDGKMSVNGLVRSENPYLFGKVDQMFITTDAIQEIANSFSDKPVLLPPTLTQLGAIRFAGEISGYFDEMVAFGQLNSNLGDVRTDILFGSNPDAGIKSYFKGNVRTQSFRLGEIFGESELGNLSCNVDVDFEKKANRPIQSNVQATISEFDFKKYKYENLSIAGTFDGFKYTGEIMVDDPNAQLNAEGIFHFRSDTSLFNFNASIQGVNFEALNLTKKYTDPLLSCTINADFKGTNIDELFGIIEVNDIYFSTAESKFLIDKVKVESTGNETDRKLQIRSDILNGELTGAYSFQHLLPALQKTLHGYIPSLVDKNEKKRSTGENNFSLQFEFENTEAFTKTLKLPFGVIEKSSVSGYYNSNYDKIYLTGDFPQFIIGKKAYENGRFTLENPQKSISFDAALASYVPKKGLTHQLHFNTAAEGDSLVSCLNWKVDAFSEYQASIKAKTEFYRSADNKQFRTLTTVSPSDVILRNNVWKLTPATVLTDEERVEVRNFSIKHENQFLGIDGAISNSESDLLNLTLRELNLEYIFNIVGIPALTFGGIATADLAASNAGGNFSVDGNLDVGGFSFNGTRLGDLNMYSEWDHAMEGIRMMGTIYNSDSVYTDVSGHIFPIKNEISLYFNANQLDVSFIQPFVKNVVTRLEGKASGLVHLFGILDFPTIEGEAYVNGGLLGFDLLNTYFTFNDTIRMSPTTIHFDNIELFDKYGHKGHINGSVHHKSFKNFKFDASIACTNMLAYNATPLQVPLINGQVFGTGMVHIKAGDNEATNIEVNMTAEKNTNLRLNFMDTSELPEYNFITYTKDKSLDFLKKKPVDLTKRKGPVNLYLKEDQPNDLNVSFNVTANPNATIELLVDPNSGDAITARGNGDLRINFGNNKDLDIFGTYTVEQGNYNFSLQQIIRKDFRIREGSTVSFNGSPFATTLDVDAMYNVTANLADLGDVFAGDNRSNNVPVRCILNITGDLQSPNIGFDIALPNSNEETQRQVTSLISSEDMMSRQIIYLLMLNKFYTPDYANVSHKSNDLAAVASATLSSQLSYLLGSMTDKVQIGTNIRTYDGTALENTEVDVMLSSQLLNNRLLINGNLGYRDNTYNANPNASTFIGEFDLEYKLTPNGNFRLKAYNHYNDRYYLNYYNNAQNIQGVGIMFKKDFDDAQQFFIPIRRYRKLQEEKVLEVAPTPPESN